MLKKLIKTQLPKLFIGYKILQAFLDYKSYLWRTGWINSVIQHRPVDESGLPVPWMNYSVIEFLRSRLNEELLVFEYGCGYSTLFFSRYVREVNAVESKFDWYELIKSQMPHNCEVVYKDLSADHQYEEAISTFQKNYDLVVIDGRRRVECLRYLLPFLDERGAILLDDSSRRRYRPIFDKLNEAGFNHITFSGLKPLSNRQHSTTIFYKNQCWLNF